MLSGENGVSSKRNVMVWFVLLWSYMAVYNQITGKAPALIYQEQLFELTLISIAAVFGEKVINAYQNRKNPQQQIPQQ